MLSEIVTTPPKHIGLLRTLGAVGPDPNRHHSHDLGDDVSVGYKLGGLVFRIVNYQA